MKFEPVAYEHSTGRAWLYSAQTNKGLITINGAQGGAWRVHMDGQWSAPFATLCEAKSHVKACKFWERH